MIRITKLGGVHFRCIPSHIIYLFYLLSLLGLAHSQYESLEKIIGRNGRIRGNEEVWIVEQQMVVAPSIKSTEHSVA
jgi:hypothetical protein